jgi:hypothetical protein
MPAYKPIYGTDAPGDFDEDQAAIDQRKLQLLAAMKNPIGGAGTGWAGGLANFFQNAIGSSLLSSEDAKSKDIAQRRQQTALDALKEIGKPKVEAQPEQNPSVPPQELEGLGGGPPVPTTYGQQPPGAAPQPGMPEQLSGPQDAPAAPPGQAGPEQLGGPPDIPPPEPAGGMVPQPPTYEYKAATPMIPKSLEEKLPLIAKMAQGGPMYAHIAQSVLTHELDAPEKEAARKAAVEDRKAAASEAARVRQHEIELKQIETARLDEHRRIDKEAENEKDRELKRELADQRAQTMAMLAGLKASGKAEGQTDLTPEAIDLAAEEYRRTKTMPALARSPNDMKAILNRAAEQMKDAGKTSAETVTDRLEIKAVLPAFTQLSKDLAFIRPYEKMLDTNAQVSKTLAQKAIATDARLANRPLNWLRQNIGDNPDVAEFLAQTHIVQTEAARVLNNPRLTGQLTDTAKREMQDIVSGNMTLGSYTRVVDRLVTDGRNRVAAMESEAGALQKRLSGDAKGASAAPAAAGPKPGDVKGGFRFKGGDPSVKANWEKV